MQTKPCCDFIYIYFTCILSQMDEIRMLYARLVLHRCVTQTWYVIMLTHLCSSNKFIPVTSAMTKLKVIFMRYGRWRIRDFFWFKLTKPRCSDIFTFRLVIDRSENGMFKYSIFIISPCIISLSNHDGIIMKICGYCSREQPYHQQRCIGCERLLTGSYSHASTAKKNDGYKNRAHVSQEPKKNIFFLFARW